jgi:ADP-ribosyl-[dinitrogen reductase] hydrolase
MLGVTGLGTQIEQRGITWLHMPIVDVNPPDARFEAVWAEHGQDLGAQLRQGGKVLVHCRGGLGRAGTVAARLLVELGVPPQDAVARVRAARPRAIETAEQLRYVLDLPRNTEATS